MAETTSRHQSAGQPPEGLAARQVRTSRGRRRSGRVVTAAVAVAAAGVLSAWRAGWLSPAGSSGPGQQGAPPATAEITRQNLSATTPVSATLGYAGAWTVRGEGSGTLTALPSGGQVIRQGQVVYRVDNGSPVVLLYGVVPAWRTLSEGVTGADVSQLNHDLVALGDASRSSISAAGWNYFSWETASGVRELEERAGVAYPPGSLLLGQVVFEPTALRVAAVTASLGGPAAGPVLTATSNRHVVTIPLDASQQNEVQKGDNVTVTLPDGTTTSGVISVVGKVATTSGPNATTTIPVEVKLTDPGAAGHLDQAPVTVNITTASVRNVLAVPVTALLALSPSGYVVEEVGPRNTRRYVPVRPGIFDETSGLVQVTGALVPGQHVVVAAP